MAHPHFYGKIGGVYTRSLEVPRKAFFLFGPRGTGKSTWIRHHLKDAFIIDLLPHKNVLPYQKNPSFIQNEVLALPTTKWIVIDEIQKVPELLDEVHYLMENHQYKKFALTGSSARKLKRGAANLLAGRAILRKMYPLTSKETNFEIPTDQTLMYGMLPMSVTQNSHEARVDYLTSYVDTYIREEVKEEGLVRHLGSFGRFLDVVALSSAQTVNVQGISRDAEVGRDSVRNYFSILEDTLLGTWLKAYRPRAKIKEIAHPKFYMFDCGLWHALAGGFKQPLPLDWKGIALEHWIFHELSSYLHYAHSKGDLGYWQTNSGSEVDFVWWYGSKIVAIEVKASKKFNSEFIKGIQSLSTSKKLKSSWIVYLGEKSLKVNQTHVLPVKTFLKKLHAGEVIGT